MRLYRVFPYLQSAAADQPGGALFLPASSHGRFDNPAIYRSFYASLDPAGAIIEHCGAFTVPWNDDQLLIRTPYADEPLRLALAEVEADVSLVDLARVEELASLTVATVLDVIARDRTRTQALARKVHETRAAASGLHWWSYYDPELSNAVLWRTDTLRLVDAPTPLTIDAPIIVSTARRFYRQIAR